MAIDERSFKSDIDAAVDDDDTVPHDRVDDERLGEHDSMLGHDPLLVNPITASGLTGEIVRPGDHTPRWVVPLFTVGCGAFITFLLLISS